MQSATRSILYVIAIIFLIAGAIDIVSQLKEGENFRWNIPLIFFGFGFGFPVFLFIYPDMFSNESAEAVEGEDSSSYSDGDGGAGD